MVLQNPIQSRMALSASAAIPSFPPSGIAWIRVECAQYAPFSRRLTVTNDLPNLPDHLRGFQLEQFFDPDSPSGEPVLNQIRDLLTEEVYGPGMKVDIDGNVIFFDRE